MSNEIKSVEKGFGDNSIFFTVNQSVSQQYRVDEIREESKQISTDSMITVYRGYKNRSLFFEMGACIDVTVCYLECQSL